MFDLERLRLLRELAHRGTMTAVAGAFRLTSSAVSQQLATLEREARSKLFERAGRRVRLTAEGARLAGHAEEILRAVEAAEIDLKAGREAPRGTLQIACFPSFAKAHLLPAVIRARKRYPELGVVLHDLEPADGIEAVRSGRCDLAVSFAYSLVPRPEVPGLVATPLLEERVLLALPPDWRLARGPIPMQRLVDAGELTEEEAAQSERRNIILQALGPDPRVKVDLSHEQLRRGDTLILCSDGLSSVVRREEIAQAVASSPDLPTLCSSLIDLANERGGPDNVTVVAVRAT